VNHSCLYFKSQVTLLVPFALLFAADNTALSNAFFGPGTGPIYLDNIACVGSELMLTNCTHDTHTADCGHNEDASVHCNIRKLHCL